MIWSKVQSILSWGDFFFDALKFLVCTEKYLEIINLWEPEWIRKIFFFMNCEYLKNVFSIKRVCGKIAPGIQWNIRKVAVESLEWTPWNFSKSTCERFSLHSPLPQLYRGFNWSLWISLLLVQILLKYLLQESCNAKTFSTNLIIYFLIDSNKQFVENCKLIKNGSISVNALICHVTKFSDKTSITDHAANYRITKLWALNYLNVTFLFPSVFLVRLL